MVTKELKFFYFFWIWPVTMCAFGRAFLPILTRQEDPSEITLRYLTGQTFTPKIYLLCVKILLNWCSGVGIILSLLGKQEMVQILLREVLRFTYLA